MRARLIRLAILGLVISVCDQSEAEPIVLHLNDTDISWRDIFDAGFRPIHVRDGVSKCHQRGVSFDVKFLEGNEFFKLGLGDIEFRLREESVVSGIVYYGKEALTLDEGAARIKLFSRVFGRYLTKEGQPLKALDSVGTVDVTSGKADSLAKFGDYRIHHGFYSSNQSEAPLLETIVIGLSLSSPKRTGRRTSPIDPPEGYEHISLSGTSEGPTPVVQREFDENPFVRREDLEMLNEKVSGWGVPILILACLAGILFVLLSNRSRE